MSSEGVAVSERSEADGDVCSPTLVVVTGCWWRSVKAAAVQGSTEDERHKCGSSPGAYSNSKRCFNSVTLRTPNGAGSARSLPHHGSIIVEICPPRKPKPTTGHV